MATNTLNTRIQLKYDSYTNWEKVKENFKPLKGELCIVNPGTQLSDASVVPCLMKVGDGEHFWKDLPWISATAADVYQWAKAANVVFEGEHLKFKDANGIVVKDIDLSAFCTEDDTNALIKAYVGDKTNLTTTKKDLIVNAINELDAEIGNLSALNTTNKNNLVAAINEALQAVEVGGTGSVVTVTKQQTPSAGSEATYVVSQGGKAVGDKIEIPKYDTSVLEVKGDSTSGVEVDNTDARRPIVKIKANTYDAHGAAAQALKDAKEYADANDANTWRPVQVNGIQALGEKTSSAEINLDSGDGVSTEWDAAGNIVRFNHDVPTNASSGDHSGVTTDEFGHVTAVNLTNYKTKQTAVSDPTADGSATAFIDSISQDDNGKITVTKKNITAAELGLSKVMEFLGTTTTAITQGSTTSSVVIDGKSTPVGKGDVVLSGDKEYVWDGSKWQELGDQGSHALKSVSITGTGYLSGGGTLEANRTIDISTAVRTKIDHGEDAYNSLSDKADKVDGATSGNFAGLDANGNLTDSGKKAADFATASQGAKADSAVQSVALASGTNNGTLKLTVDGKATDNIAVKGLGALAYKSTLGRIEVEEGGYVTYVEANEDGGLDLVSEGNINIESSNKVNIASIAGPVNIESNNKINIASTTDSVNISGYNVTIGSDNSCEVRFGQDRALEIDAEEINFVASETDADPVLKVNGKALSTDHIEAGTEVWIFNCGTATTVL